ncbi:hypothetical protein [Luteibacter yeojuensis]|uniref:Uncharacterized protein n=1 Tax=Luteibacter yeojuensis TaxID=345309 RepID=A0A0F3KU46_9GAMM|nr:hypothetical protein [Luteibacter yeojuensis]KJV34738.1 hypothetical protein VI08_09060 [Luteibacter yeojuensis]
MATDSRPRPPTLLGLVSLGLEMTVDAAKAGDFAGARMSLAHVRELATRPALGSLRPALKLLAGVLGGPEPREMDWRVAFDAVWRAVESMGTKPAVENPYHRPGNH